MDARTAANWINTQMHLMTGHKVRARPHPYQDKVTLQFQIDTVDTDNYWVRPERITVAPELVGDVSRCRTADDLCRVVFDQLMYALAHEHREGLRVGQSMDAPFHPHHGYMGSEGDRRFQATDHLTPHDYVLGSVRAAV